MSLCPICMQPECSESVGGERPGTATHSTRLAPGEREYRGYNDWAVHPDEARFLLHRGYALVEGERRQVHFDHNEAFVTQIVVQGTSREVNIYEGIP